MSGILSDRVAKRHILRVMVISEKLRVRVYLKDMIGLNLFAAF
jgi:hypothetical protein